MKKILLLALMSWSIISCGVNTLNTDKLELKKLPVYDTTLTPQGLYPASPSLLFYEATFEGVIPASGTHTETVPNYEAPVVPATEGSHKAFVAYAKDSDVFGAPASTPISLTGVITVAGQVGNKYRIWTPSVKKLEI